jgi:mRNA interferase MazF
MNSIKRGEIYFCYLDGIVGSEQGGIRPVLIIQNDVSNRHAPTTIVLPITSQQGKNPLPTHVKLSPDCGLHKESTILAEQVRTVDKKRLKSKLGAVNSGEMGRVDDAVRVSFFGLPGFI